MSSYGYVPYDHNKRVPDPRPGPRSPEEGAQSRGATPASSQDAASGREGRRDRARGRHRAGRGDWTPAGQSYGVAPRTSASHGAASQGPPSGPTASKPAPPLSLPGSIPPPDAPRPAPPAGAPRPAFRPSAPDSAPPAGAPRVVPPAGAGAPRVVPPAGAGAPRVVPPAGAPGPAPRSRAPGAPRVVPPPGAARPAGAPPLGTASSPSRMRAGTRARADTASSPSRVSAGTRARADTAARVPAARDPQIVPARAIRPARPERPTWSGGSVWGRACGPGAPWWCCAGSRRSSCGRPCR